MADTAVIEAIARAHGCAELRWISGSAVKVRQWVRFKCMYGCPSYGKKGSCPPAVPSIPECRELFAEYERVLILRFPVTLPRPEDRGAWGESQNRELLLIERDAFLAGYPKALLLFPDECRFCQDCPGTRIDCRNPTMVRPSPESLGVDVFSTVRAAGFEIEVLPDPNREMSRYAFLLVD